MPLSFSFQAGLGAYSIRSLERSWSTMTFEVPEYLGLAGGGDHDALSMLKDYHLTDELLGLLRNGDGAGSSAAHAHGSSVDEKLSPALPQPPSMTTAATSTAGDQQILSWSALAGEAEMASWLRQVFEEASDDHEPQGAASNKSTTARTRSSSDREDPAVAADMSTRDGGAAARKRPEGSSKPECCGGCCRPRSSGKRTCAGRASEQRRRDKINEKMRTLQQLVPRCSKTDKASTLDGVIRYMKSLQHQLQVLSNGYAMQTPILPPAGVVQPPHMLPAGVFGSMHPGVMLPDQYPFLPAMLACPHHGNGSMTPPPLPLFRPAAAGPSATQQLPHHHQVPNLALPTHEIGTHQSPRVISTGLLCSRRSQK